ncbi:MAG: FAD-binding protein [Myxococcales bacterium]|nr:FAD-binding protein [Myxococcales bacterium]
MSPQDAPALAAPFVEEGALSWRGSEPLSRHTALRTGGCCEAWAVAHTAEALAALVDGCRKQSHRFLLLGAATRVLFRDGPVAGVVARLGAGFAQLRDDGESWHVGAACPVPSLVARACEVGAAGFEAHACTPGSVGASLLWDDDWEGVEAVEILRRGKVVEVPHEAVRGKRTVLVLGARLRVTPADAASVRRRVVDRLRHGEPVPPGSWYRATKPDAIRDVFRSVRLQMVRLRQVAIPQAAPETLVNLGGGTAADFALLQKSAVERVKKVRNEQLEGRLRPMGQALQQ